MVRLIPILCLSAVLGCAGSGFNGPAFQGDVVRGQYEAALERLESFSDTDVSALLDRGLLLQAQGRFPESNRAFAAAELLIEDLYTRSLSKEALALLTSDRALDYRASDFEYAYIAYYRAWNYLQMGQPEGVLVEARRINERLSFRAENCGDTGNVCGHDVFLRYFSGLLFEWGGERNSAYIAYKQAHEARLALKGSHRNVLPPDLGLRLVRLAQRMGFGDEADVFAETYGIETEGVSGVPRSSIIVLWENGIVGRRQEVSAVIPIFKGETNKIAEDTDAWSVTLADRRHMRYESARLEYLLRISLPEYVSPPPAGSRAKVLVGSVERESHPVAVLSVMAADALDNAMKGILVRAVARGLVKYLASRAADKNVGEGAGLIVNLIGAGLENADTRSWRSLPYEIQLVSLEIPPGRYDARLLITDRRGETLENRDYRGIQVPADGIAFIRHRSTP